MKLIPHYSQHPYYWDPRLHLLYVEDSRRVGPFEKAIYEVVRPGKVVADIGTGTGLLARFAHEAGAIKVYAIDRDKRILQWARRINEELTVNGHISLVQGDAREVILAEKVDVIVAELIGGLGNDEAMSDILENARTRFLKADGTMIPKKVDVYICPVEAPEAHEQIQTVYKDDLIVPPDKYRPSFKAYYEILGLPPDLLLSEYQVLDTIDLMAHTDLDYRREYTFKISRNGLFSGFAVWFKAQLSDNIILDTSPWAPCTCWGQSFLAVRKQTKLSKGDLVELSFSAIVTPGKDRPFYVWEGIIKRGQKALAHFNETNKL